MGAASGPRTPQVLEESLGKDISDTFRGIGEHGYHEHSRSAMRLMAQMQVGRLFTDAELSATPTPAASDSGSGTSAKAGARESSFQLDRTKGVVFQVRPAVGASTDGRAAGSCGVLLQTLSVTSPAAQRQPALGAASLVVPRVARNALQQLNTPWVSFQFPKN